MKFAYYLPVFVAYTDDLPDIAGGMALYRFLWGKIKIRPKYVNDQGILKHELQHLKIYARAPVVNWIRSRLSKKVQYQFELECYRVQLRYSPWDIDTFAFFLANKYGFNVTEQQAKTDLLR